MAAPGPGVFCLCSLLSSERQGPAPGGWPLWARLSLLGGRRVLPSQRGQTRALGFPHRAAARGRPGPPAKLRPPGPPRPPRCCVHTHGAYTRVSTANTLRLCPVCSPARGALRRPSGRRARFEGQVSTRLDRSFVWHPDAHGVRYTPSEGRY